MKKIIAISAVILSFALFSFAMPEEQPKIVKLSNGNYNIDPGAIALRLTQADQRSVTELVQRLYNTEETVQLAMLPAAGAQIVLDKNGTNEVVEIQCVTKMDARVTTGTDASNLVNIIDRYSVSGD